MSDELIKIVDHKEKKSLKDVSGFVVKIGGNYYYKDSERVVNVQGRYYRKKSPLIQLCQHPNNHYCLREDAILLYNGEYANRLTTDIVTVVKPFDTNGKELHFHNDTLYACLDQVIRSKTKFYIKEFEETVKSFYTGVEILKREAVKLSSLYGNNVYVENKKGIICFKCEVTNEYFLLQDVFSLRNPVDRSKYYVNKGDAAKLNVVPVFTGRLIDSSPRGLSHEYLMCDIDSFSDHIVFVGEIEDYVIKGREDQAIKAEAELAKQKISGDDFIETVTDDHRKFSDLGFSFNEPTPSKLYTPRGDINGAEIYFKPSEISRRPHFSQSKQMTGGIGYTFGVEKETCAGIVPNHICDKYGFSKIGDGSTRYRMRNPIVHFEYVSSVLHGDIGVYNLKSFVEQAARHTIFNEKCSTHIHVGGQATDRLSTDIPKFNREFSAYAIKLGARIEKSLNELFSAERDIYTNPQCGSIQRYLRKPITTREQRNSLIADYVFNSRRLNANTNSLSNVSKWSDSKRKWLNLINCNSHSTHRREKAIKTVEFRIFPPTNNPDKMHFYVLIALAFVWFVENRRKMIVDTSKTISIQDVLQEAYSKKPIYKFVEEQLKLHLNNNKK